MKSKKISHILIDGIKEAYGKEGGDFYHDTLQVSHSKFIGIFVVGFLTLNAIFGALYFFIPGTISLIVFPSVFKPWVQLVTVLFIQRVSLLTY